MTWDLVLYSPLNKTCIARCQKQNGSDLSTCFYVCLSHTCSEVLKQLKTTLHRRGHSDSYDFGLELETVLAKAQVEVSTYLMPQIVTGEGNIVFHWEWDNLNRTTANVHGNNIVNSACGIILTNMLPIVQVIDKKKLRWFGHVMRREEESMLRVVMHLTMKGKIPRRDNTKVAR